MSSDTRTIFWWCPRGCDGPVKWRDEGGCYVATCKVCGLVSNDIVAQRDALIEILDRHHRLAAEARRLLHNEGAGPNLAQLKRCDALLREIAGLPAA